MRIVLLLAVFASLLLRIDGGFAFSSKEIFSPEKEEVDEWSYSLAIQAASWGAPLVTMYAFRHHIALGPNPKAVPNTLWRMEDISTPELSEKEGYVTPNVNTIYGFGFLDLRDDPIVIVAPDSNDRYYMVEILDMWTNVFAYIGGKTTGYKGGKFLLVGPDWKGDLPEGIRPIFCPTPWVLIQPRVHSYSHGEIDLPGASAILKAIIPIPLSTFLGKEAPMAGSYDYPAPGPISPDLPVSVLEFKDPLQFWELFSMAMNENPPPDDQISALLPMFHPLGIVLGQDWDRSKIEPKVLTAMSKAAEKIGSILEHV